MPNWCDNKLTVTGSVEAIRRFVEAAECGKGHLSVQQFIPLPEELEVTIADNQQLNYMVFVVGTKWDLEAVRVLKRKPNRMEYYFATAWSPPGEWIKTISREFPELSFKLWYEETGNGFRGEVLVQNEAVVYDVDLTAQMSEEMKKQRTGEEP